MIDKIDRIELNRELFRDKVFDGLLDFLGEHKGDNFGDYFLCLDMLNLNFEIEQPALIEFSPCNIPLSAILTEDYSNDFAHLGYIIPDVVALDEALDIAFLSLYVQTLLN